ncbi:MAG TPA: oligoribonuclease [Planctomycetes bacterium]|nr:oligoribonuclease [Planctomycetota bacterium]
MLVKSSPVASKQRYGPSRQALVFQAFTNIRGSLGGGPDRLDAEEGEVIEGHLVWIDLEMTGLDPTDCTILEIASIVTDKDLSIVEEGPNLVIHHSDEVLDAMDEWNRSHHGASGLIAAAKASTITLAEAEQSTLAFLRRHVEEGSSPLCGNTIGTDRTFLARHMPELENFLHYRVIDVSSIKELVKRWYGESFVPEKNRGHRALDDIRESIEELKHYRRTVFLPAPQRFED